MKTIQFKCNFLTDIIISQKAATEGNQATIDFIPGNTFLGVAAGKIYRDEDKETALLLLHSGKVMFGDAHPLINNRRALRVPASWNMIINSEEDSDNIKISLHHSNRTYDRGEKGDSKYNSIVKKQKQCRKNFIVKQNDKKINRIEVERNFAIKSAYDKDRRCSAEGKMYGYESMQQGSEWCFEVILAEEVKNYEKIVIEALSGIHKIGKSSTAQYGLVNIEVIDNSKNIDVNGGFTIGCQLTEEFKDKVFIYAERRFIFFDEYGQPTFTPTIKQLGLDKGYICWEDSQIRTFKYAPFNNKRKARDPERCGIEKGSVFCVKDAAIPSVSSYKVGYYKNEGFGNILINPEFLKEEVINKIICPYLINRDDEGKKVKEQELYTESKDVFSNDVDKKVIQYLIKQREKEKLQNIIYKEVNSFVNREMFLFKKESFASQWGAIRSIAMQTESAKDLKNKLYKGDKGYLTHGVAAEKWEGKRIEKVKKFICDLEKKSKNLNLDFIVKNGVINLAAEMAKKCVKEEKQ